MEQQYPLPLPSGAGDAYDEMASGGRLRPHWTPVFDAVAGQPPRRIADRLARGRRHLTEFGIGARPDAEDSGWALDPIPLLLTDAEWRRLAAMVTARMRALDALLRDLYGPMTVVAEGVVPADVVFADPRFLRPLRNPTATPERQLTLYAADLQRGPDGAWWVVADHAEAPVGLGETLLTRRVLARGFPDLYAVHPIVQLAPLIAAWADALADATDCPILLSPGRHSVTYLDQAVLAHRLGLDLLEPDDLTVRDGRLWVKRLGGLTPVSTVLRRVLSEYADPLELRPDSLLGVPGLAAAARAGRVRLLNALGAGLAASSTLTAALPHLGDASTTGASAPPAAASLAPVWTADGLAARPVTLRAFAIAIDDAIRVLPGGIAWTPGPSGERQMKDVWVLEPDSDAEDGAVARAPAGDAGHHRPSESAAAAAGLAALPSRVADALFWAGRYGERIDLSGRLARHALSRLAMPPYAPHDLAEAATARAMLGAAGALEPDDARAPIHGVAARTALLGVLNGSIGRSLDSLRGLIPATGEQISGDAGRALVDLAGTRHALHEAGGEIDAALDALDSMLDGWARAAALLHDGVAGDRGAAFLALGRAIERCIGLSRALAAVLEPPRGRPAGAALDAILMLVDAPLADRRAALLTDDAIGVALSLVLADDARPRSLAAQGGVLRRAMDAVDAGLDRRPPWPELDAVLAPLAATAAGGGDLSRHLADTAAAAERLSDALTRAYFTQLPRARLLAPISPTDGTVIGRRNRG